MALTMADFIEKKGLGQDINVSDVALSANDLAKLSRIRGLDPRGMSGNLGIQQAQEIMADLPRAADLGLVLEQNKQLKAAGGRGYEGNVHNLQGQATPFEKLTASIAAAQPTNQGIQQSTIQPSNPAWQPQEGGGDREGRGYDRTADMDTLEYFGQEAFKDWGLGTLSKGVTSGALAYGIGAPTGLAAKFGLSSMFGPLTALLGMGNMAYSGALDMSHDQAAKAEGIDVGSLDMDAMNRVTQQGFHPAFMGYEDEFDYQSIQEEMEKASTFDKIGMAIDAAIKGPEGGWTAQNPDNIDPVTGIHKAQMGSMDMGVSQAMGLQSSFGDPLGIGLGGSANSGNGGSGGSSGGFGGSGFGDRESSGGYGGMGGI
jgi:hypothetical protein